MANFTATDVNQLGPNESAAGYCDTGCPSCKSNFSTADAGGPANGDR